GLARTIWAMNVTQPRLRRHFWETVFDCLRNKPSNFEYVIMMSVFYLHLGTFAQVLIKDLDRQIAELDAGLASEAVPLVRAAGRRRPSNGGLGHDLQHRWVIVRS